MSTKKSQDYPIGIWQKSAEPIAIILSTTVILIIAMICLKIGTIILHCLFSTESWFNINLDMMSTTALILTYMFFLIMKMLHYFKNSEKEKTEQGGRTMNTFLKKIYQKMSLKIIIFYIIVNFIILFIMNTLFYILTQDYLISSIFLVLGAIISGGLVILIFLYYKIPIEKVVDFKYIRIYLIPAVFAIFIYVLLSRDKTFTDIENARYLLSALTQSEAAVIAIVITMNLIGIQLGSTYPLRVIRIFSNSPEFKTLILLYVVAILYGLFVLGIVGPNQEIHIVISYSLAVFCFTALISYTINLLDIIEPSTSIEKWSHRISKTSILNGEDVLHLIIDILKVFVLKRDEETVEFGLRTIGGKIGYMFENEEFNEGEQREVSNKIYGNLIELGRFAVEQGDEDSAWNVIANIEEIGKKAIEEDLARIALRAAISLSTLGHTVIKRRNECLARQAAVRLYDMGEAAIDKEIHIALNIVELLDVVGRNAYNFNLETVTSEVEIWLEQLRESAIRKKNGRIVSYLDKRTPRDHS